MARTAHKNSVSFKGLHASSKQSTAAKKANRRSGAKHEELLFREVRRHGLYFRKNEASVFGVPDLVFRNGKIAVFCDGDFWHGRDWQRLRKALLRRHNAEYWIAKIKRNRKRDREVTQNLLKNGWSVIRIWETDILRAPEALCS
jgi:DNA mismatch endonuclease (patch repair protein)